MCSIAYRFARGMIGNINHLARKRITQRGTNSFHKCILIFKNSILLYRL